MLKSLRRVRFPENLEVSGPVVKAKLISHIKDHDELLEKANESANHILIQAKIEAQQIRESVEKRVVNSFKKDVESIRELTHHKEKKLLQQSAKLCTEVCTTVFQQLIDNLPPEGKIHVLVEKLLATAHHGRTIQLNCHLEQVELVENAVAKVMAQQMNLRQWTVIPSPDLTPYEIVISTPNGAEISVSLENLLAIYKEEIAALSSEIDPLFHANEEDNESIN